MLKFYNFRFCVGAQQIFQKISEEIFGRTENLPYLCQRYPENNLFTLEN
jgi:hypothetical protein